MFSTKHIKSCKLIMMFSNKEIFCRGDNVLRPKYFARNRASELLKRSCGRKTTDLALRNGLSKHHSGSKGTKISPKTHKILPQTGTTATKISTSDTILPTVFSRDRGSSGRNRTRCQSPATKYLRKGDSIATPKLDNNHNQRKKEHDVELHVLNLFIPRLSQQPLFLLFQLKHGTSY